MNFRIINLLIAFMVSSYTLADAPSIQEKVIDRIVSQRMLNIPSHLFVDDALRIVLCGSAAPMPVKDRAAACVMVIAGGNYYLVDTGNRSSNNIALWRIPAEKVGAVFLTHFHSDHIGDLGEFNMMTWAQGRPNSLPVYGPTGVKQVVDGFTQAYALDSLYRTAHHGEDYLNSLTGKMIAHEITLKTESEVILDDGSLKVTMFNVNHAPITPAVGYRFDYKGRSVVISGDTTKTASVAKISKGADVLFHEALSPTIVKRMEAVAKKSDNKQLEKIMHDILDYHTSPVEAAEVANEAGVKELVLYHLAPAPPIRLAEFIFTQGVNDVRPNGVTLGYDGMVLTLPLSSKDIIESEL